MLEALLIGFFFVFTCGAFFHFCIHRFFVRTVLVGFVACNVFVFLVSDYVFSIPWLAACVLIFVGGFFAVLLLIFLSKRFYARRGVIGDWV